MAISYYRIKGTIRFYVFNQLKSEYELYSEHEFITSYSRQKLIKDFLQRVKHITYLLQPYYICVPIEDTISQTTHTPNKRPIDYEHKVKYAMNNARKYIEY